MSIFDEVVSKVTASLADSGQVNGLMKAALDLLNSPQIGGLSGLVKTFQEKGLGEVVSSWVSTGANLPISADQIKAALGSDSLAKLVESSGLSMQSITDGLASLLPEVVDKLTPDGTVPESNLLEQGLNLLKSKLLS